MIDTMNKCVTTADQMKMRCVGLNSKQP